MTELKKIAPKLELPEGETLKGKTLNLPDAVFRVRTDQGRQAFHGSDRPEPGITGAARDADDLLHGLPGQRVWCWRVPGSSIKSGRSSPPGCTGTSGGT